MEALSLQVLKLSALVMSSRGKKRWQRHHARQLDPELQGSCKPWGYGGSARLVVPCAPDESCDARKAIFDHIVAARLGRGEDSFGRMARGSAGMAELVYNREVNPWQSVEAFELLCRR